MSHSVNLSALLASGVFVRAIGVHDGLTALLAERAGFEAVWAGGLGISSAHGLPDAGLLTMTEFHQDAIRIRRSTALPVIADVDCGFGDSNVVRRMVRLYESAGIDAVCIEDKQYPKRNSFRNGHVLEHPKRFADKLAVAKSAQQGSEFMVIARLESLIAGAGMEDAMTRAELYCQAGADALLIHSRLADSSEVAEFCSAHHERAPHVPIFTVPTTYYRTSGTQLSDLGAAGAIYANQVIRAAVSGIQRMLDSLITTDSTAAMEKDITAVSELFDLVGVGNLIGDEPWDGLTG